VDYSLWLERHQHRDCAVGALLVLDKEIARVPDLSLENANWLLDWIWLAISRGWPVLVASPGLIAFWWQWRDRRAKHVAQKPYIKVEADSRIGDRFGWQFVRIHVRNDASVPIELRSLSVKPPFVLAKKAYNNEPDVRTANQSIQMSLRVGRSEENETYAFVGSTLRSMSQVQLSIRAQYSEMSAARRKGDINIKSEPIDVPHITISKTSKIPISAKHGTKCRL